VKAFTAALSELEALRYFDHPRIVDCPEDGTIREEIPRGSRKAKRRSLVADSQVKSGLSAIAVRQKGR
jgi:hypothetical protein